MASTTGAPPSTIGHGFAQAGRISLLFGPFRASGVSQANERQAGTVIIVPSWAGRGNAFLLYAELEQQAAHKKKTEADFCWSAPEDF
jgi:hypothetical protein